MEIFAVEREAIDPEMAPAEFFAPWLYTSHSPALPLILVVAPMSVT